VRRTSLLLLLLLAASSAALAQTFPPHPEGSAVYDSANLLSPADERQISDLAQRFMEDTGAPIVVATFPSLRQVGAQSMGIERYSTELFNRWHIGRNKANGGILLLVAKEDRKVRIELGRDWKKDYDREAKGINQSIIVPAFRQGDYAAGIVDGANALANMAGSSGFEDPNESGPLTPVFLFLGGCCCCAIPVIAIAALITRQLRKAAYGGPGSYSNQAQGYDDPPPSDAASFLTGLAVGEMMSAPPVDPDPYDNERTFDSGSSYDSGGSFDSSSGFDSGDSGGGGDTGSW